MEDRELMALLDSSPIQGRELLEALYREPVRLAAWQHLDSAQDVEVCVRETFAEFAAKRQRFDPSKGSLRGYLITIAARKAIRRWTEGQKQKRP